jgi:hypothetical protein
MGQKSNILTLRKSYKNFNFLNEKQENFVLNNTFKSLVERIFALKNILIVQSTFNFSNNQIFCNLHGYIRYSKLKFYKKQKYIKNTFRKTSDNSNLVELFGLALKLLRITSVILKFTSLNRKIDKSLLISFYQKIKYTKKLLFARRHSLFIDFLAVTCLFFQGFLNSGVFLKILGEVFKVLPKRRHTLFLSFIKKLFKILIDEKYSKFQLSSSKILGFKFTLSGKIQGKLRGSSSTVYIGQVPIQSFDKNVEFSKIHIFTIFGVFGMKL